MSNFTRVGQSVEYPKLMDFCLVYLFVNQIFPGSKYEIRKHSHKLIFGIFS